MDGRRDKEIQYKNVGQEHNNTAYTTNDAIDYHILDRALRKYLLNEHTYLLHQPLDALHRVLAKHEGSFKHDKQ